LPGGVDLGLEVEIKFRCPDINNAREKIEKMGGKSLGPWYLEKNIVLDTAAGELEGQGKLLRLRTANSRGKLTFKAPENGRKNSGLKVMQEMETQIGDVQSMQEILARLGYYPRLRYEKFRKKWELLGAVVCLDILPFGRFLELEGDSHSIPECVNVLNLDAGSGSKGTYYDLYRESSQYSGNPDFVFSSQAKEDIARELEMDIEQIKGE
jgi:adenylate cyclase class 2